MFGTGSRIFRSSWAHLWFPHRFARLTLREAKQFASLVGSSHFAILRQTSTHAEGQNPASQRGRSPWRRDPSPSSGYSIFQLLANACRKNWCFQSGVYPEETKCLGPESDWRRKALYYVAILQVQGKIFSFEY